MPSIPATSKKLEMSISVDKKSYTPGSLVIIEGSVWESEDGLPQQGASVKLEVDGIAASDATDPEGRHRIEFILPSDAQVGTTYTAVATASKTDWESARGSKTFTVTGEGMLSVEIKTDKKIYGFGEAFTGTMRVRDKQANPVPGADVKLLFVHESGASTDFSGMSDTGGEMPFSGIWQEEHKGSWKIEVIASKDKFSGQGSLTIIVGIAGKLKVSLDKTKEYYGVGEIIELSGDVTFEKAGVTDAEVNVILLSAGKVVWKGKASTNQLGHFESNIPLEKTWIQDPPSLFLDLRTDKARYQRGEAVTIKGESTVRSPLTIQLEASKEGFTPGGHQMKLSIGKPFAELDKLFLVITVPDLSAPAEQDTRSILKLAPSEGTFSIMPIAGYRLGEYSVEARAEGGGMKVTNTISFRVGESQRATEAQISEILRLYKERVPHGRIRSDKTAKILPGRWGTWNNLLYGKNGFECVGYRDKVLYFLDSLRFSQDPKERALLRGLDYGPVQRGFGKKLAVQSLIGLSEHHVAIFYRTESRYNWRSDETLVLDPWPNQMPEVFTMKEFKAACPEASCAKNNHSVHPDPEYSQIISYSYPLVNSPVYLNFECKEWGINRPVSPFRGLYVAVQCPVDVLITNSEGKSLGILEDGSFSFEIPGSELIILADDDGTPTWLIGLPEGAYQASIKGYRQGSFNVLVSGKDGSVMDYGSQPIEKDHEVTLILSSSDISSPLTLASGEKVYAHPLVALASSLEAADLEIPERERKAKIDLGKWRDDWHDKNGNAYSYRMPVAISSEVELADYQLAITLDPVNFNYNHVQPDGKDLRVVVERDWELFDVPHWIEEWDPEGLSKIWARIPSIKGKVEIYLYYGNSDVDARTSGKDVFEFFDDFSDLSEWTVYGRKPTLAIVDGRTVAQISGPSEIVHPISLDGSDYAFQSSSKLIFGMQAYMPFLGFGTSDRRDDEDNAYQFGYNVWRGNLDSIRVLKNRLQRTRIDGSSAYSRRTDWARTEFIVSGGSLTQVVSDESKGVQRIIAQDSYRLGAMPKEVGIIIWSGASYAVDLLFIRKYQEPEPGYTLGSEEKKPPITRDDIDEILSLIRTSQENMQEQSDFINKMAKEIELLRTRTHELEREMDELKKPKPSYKSILDLSLADEPWAREWSVLATAKDFTAGGGAGFYPEAVRSGDASPNPGRRGILYLHPVTSEEPATIARTVTLTGERPTLRLGVSGNRDGDGDWALLIRVNGKALEEERIIAGAEGWQDLSFDLSDFSGETVDIQIDARANDWFYEYAFFDYIRIDTE